MLISIRVSLNIITRSWADYYDNIGINHTNNVKANQECYMETEGEVSKDLFVIKKKVIYKTEENMKPNKNKCTIFNVLLCINERKKTYVIYINKIV